MEPNNYDPGYGTLDARKIRLTLAELQGRIDARFPGAGLGRVCRQLSAVADQTQARVAHIEQRNLPLRIFVGIVIALATLLLLQIAKLFDLSKTSADSVYTLLQGIEATMNIFVLMGGAMFFLFTVEERVKRRRALEALHELRAVAHVIDMHQLTKDPSSDRPATVATLNGPDAPQRAISPFELSRYLDYCSELLSLTAKVAALYAQSLPDDVVVEAVSDLERVTTNMSQKVWQKIMIIQALQQMPRRPPAARIETTTAQPLKV